MNERAKLNEAHHFSREMWLTQKDREKFEFNLSAFVNAGRCVLQYAYDEAEPKGQVAWYNGVMKAPVVKLFRDMRNINIHERPVKPKLDVNVSVGDVVNFSGSLEHGLVRNGEIVSNGVTVDPPNSLSVTAKESEEFEYFFPEWTQGPENVLDLSIKYLAALETAVLDGQALNILTK